MSVIEIMQYFNNEVVEEQNHSVNDSPKLDEVQLDVSEESVSRSDESALKDFNTDKALPVIQKEMEDMINVDWDYMKYLDLMSGVVAVESGIVENFRFNNGYISKIKRGRYNGASEARLARYDEGEGSAYIMKQMFVSSSGTLSIGGRFDSFDPTPEYMAWLFQVIYCMRRNYQDRRSCLDGSVPKLSIDVNGHLDHEYYDKFLENNILSFDDPYKKMKIRNLGQKSKWDCLMYLIYKDKRRSRVHNFLHHIKVMIEEQESDDENQVTSDRPIPKYTLEKMLLAYFTMRFDDGSVKPFYSELKKGLTCSKSYTETQKSKRETLDRIKSLHNVYRRKMFNSGIPYNSHLIQNGSSRIITVDPCDRNVLNITSKKCFSDCAETCVRHIVNLLTYDGGHKKEFPICISQDVDEDELFNLQKFIYSGGSHARKTLRDRINLFYKIQGSKNVNNSCEFYRTLWNYVVSNMDSFHECELFSIMYRYNGNEMKSGFINMLKLCYNIAYAVKDGLDINFEKAQSSISLLEDKCDGKSLERAMVDTFSLLSDDISKIGVKVSSEYMGVTSKDVFGKADVSVTRKDHSEFHFSINQKEGHAHLYVKNVGRFDIHDQDILSQDVIILGVSNFCLSPLGLNEFNAEFLSCNKNTDRKENFYERARALRFYRETESYTTIQSLMGTIKNTGTSILTQSKNICLNDKQTLLDYFKEKIIDKNIYLFVDFCIDEKIDISFLKSSYRDFEEVLSTCQNIIDLIFSTEHINLEQAMEIAKYIKSHFEVANYRNIKFFLGHIIRDLDGEEFKQVIDYLALKGDNLMFRSCISVKDHAARPLFREALNLDNIGVAEFLFYNVSPRMRIGEVLCIYEKSPVCFSSLKKIQGMDKYIVLAKIHKGESVKIDELDNVETSLLFVDSLVSRCIMLKVLENFSLADFKKIIERKDIEEYLYEKVSRLYGTNMLEHALIKEEFDKARAILDRVSNDEGFKLIRTACENAYVKRAFNENDLLFFFNDFVCKRSQ